MIIAVLESIVVVLYVYVIYIIFSIFRNYALTSTEKVLFTSLLTMAILRVLMAIYLIWRLACLT